MYICSALLHCGQIRQLHLVINKAWDLHEQLYIFAEKTKEEKAQLIQLWQQELQQLAPEYYAEHSADQHVIQVLRRQADPEFILQIAS